MCVYRWFACKATTQGLRLLVVFEQCARVTVRVRTSDEGEAACLFCQKKAPTTHRKSFFAKKINKTMNRTLERSKPKLHCLRAHTHTHAAAAAAAAAAASSSSSSSFSCTTPVGRGRDGDRGAAVVGHPTLG